MDGGLTRALKLVCAVSVVVAVPDSSLVVLILPTGNSLVGTPFSVPCWMSLSLNYSLMVFLEVEKAYLLVKGLALLLSLTFGTFSLLLFSF